GFYENAFALIKSVYAERVVDDPDEALPTWRDAFKPQSFTPLCIQRDDGTYERVNVQWPTNCDEPGDGLLALTPWGVVTELVSARELLMEPAAASAGGGAPPPPPLRSRSGAVADVPHPGAPAQVAAALVEARRRAHALASTAPRDHGLLRLIFEAL